MKGILQSFSALNMIELGNSCVIFVSLNSPCGAPSDYGICGFHFILVEVHQHYGIQKCDYDLVS